MRLKIIFIISFFVINISSVFSAQVNSPNIDFSSFWDFYSSNRFFAEACGRGYTGLAKEQGIVGAILNPASLNIKKKNQIYAEYVFKTDIRWIEDNTHLNQLHPALLSGMGFYVNDCFQTGFVVTTGNSYKIDFGSGNSIDCRINSLLIPVSYQSKDIKISKKHSINLRLGMSLLFSNYTLKEINGTNIARVNFDQVYPKFGLIVYPDSNDDRLSFGLTYLPKREKRIEKIWTIVDDEFFQPNVFPYKVGIGFKYRFTVKPIILSADFNHSGDVKADGLLARNDLNLGADYTIRDNLILRAGIFSQEDYRKHQVNSFGQIFITFGASYKVKDYIFHSSIMQGVISESNIRQTYLNLAIEYNF